MDKHPFERPTRRRLLQSVAGLGTWAALGAARADERALLRIVLPYPAGGLSDVSIRAVAASMARSLDRPVIVDNRPGAAGLIGTHMVQVAPADGSVLLYHNIGFVGLPMLQKETRYDPLKDFTPVASVADGPAFIVVHQSVPARTLPEFIAWARVQPHPVESATSGVNGASHISTLMFAKMAGIALLPVPYKGGAEQQTAMLTGESKLLISNMSEVVNAQVKLGNLRVLAICSDRPSALAPGVPLASDTVPGFVIQGWNALFAPAGTPPPVVARLSDAVRVAIEEPGFRERLAGMYLDARYQSPQQLAASERETRAFYQRVVTELGITAS